MSTTTIVSLALAFGAVFLASYAILATIGTLGRLSRGIAESPGLTSVRTRIVRDLSRAADTDDATDWLARAIAQDLLLAAGAACLVAAAGLGRIPVGLLPVAIAAAGGLVSAASFAVRLHGLRARAEARIRRVVRLLPYSIELIVLIAEAGGSLEDGLSAVVDSMPGEPLSDEFARVLSEQRLGRSFLDAFHAMAVRLDNRESTQLVTSIEIGRDLGTALAASLATFAEWIRTKRVLDGERLAREAAPKMALPNTMIMAANVLLILAPFLPALSRGDVL